jgi:amino acid adenylation domain-containing protein
MASTPTTIIDLLEDHVQRYPNQVAIDEDGERLVTYATLWRSSRKIVSVIADSKNEVNTLRLVAICLDRSAQLIYSAWGVLMSAQAYIFLDPADANNRNKLMVETFKVSRIITSRTYARKYRDFGVEVTVIDEVLEDSAFRERDAKLPPINPTSTAYVLQTSGSSGTPKGVVISHQAALPGVTAFSLDGKTRWLFLFNPIHSASQRLIIGVFCKGGTLCIVQKERLTQLPDVLYKNRIEALGITPSLLKTLDPTKLPGCLRQIVSISEPMPQSLANSFAAHVDLHIAYGLSEVAQLNIKRKFNLGDRSSLLAWPSDQTMVKILIPGTDKEVGKGDLGELCFIGPQLADGYLYRPEVTEKAFQANPFGPGKILRTGDEAVATDDGFTITGRLDDMVKINGQKLEPGEVQAVLDKHSNVIQSCVIALELQEVRSAVAVVHLRPGTDWQETKLDLLSSARQYLPTYMIPSYWLRATEIPYTIAGKLDRQRLIAQIKATSIDDMLLRPPTLSKETLSVVEMTIRDVFANVLRIPPCDIPRDASFPDLGGDSMQAFEVIRILRQSNFYLTLESIIGRRDSIYEMSKTIGRVPQALLGSSVPVVEDSQEFPLTETQESLIHMTMGLGSRDYTYQRLWDVRFVDIDRLEWCFQQLPSMRTTVIEKPSGLFQAPSKKSLPVTRIKGSLENYLLEDLARGFTFGQPFARLAHIQEGDNVSVLVETRHHALFDFHSSGFVFDDVAMLYKGQSFVVRPPYRHFVSWLLQKDWGITKSFWAQHLMGVAPCQLNDIPVVGTGIAIRTIGNVVKRVADLHGVSEASIINTAWAIVLGKQLGTDDVVFGTTFSGRDENILDVENMDGPTMAVALLRLGLGGRLRDVLRRGHTVLNDVWKHSQYGLRRILKAAATDASLFDTLVNFVHARYGHNALFVPFGPKPRWRTDRTTLSVEKFRAGADKSITYEICLTGKMEDIRLRFLLDQFVKIIDSMLTESGKDLQWISVIGDEECKMLSERQPIPHRHQMNLLCDYNAMVTKHPTNIAVQFESREFLSYRSLEEKANRLAWCLIRRYGIKQGDFVCLMFKKSIDAIIAIFAVLKAGAAFVPLNPASPNERKRNVVSNTNARMVLSMNRSLIQENLGIEIVSIDSIDYAAYPASTPDQIKHYMNDNAYVICTSGSTGKPKAVPITHGAAAAAVAEARRLEGLCPGDRYLQFSDYVFDAVIYEVFCILGAGGTLCVVSEKNRISDLARLLNEMRVTHIVLVPPVARDLAQQNPAPQFLKSIVIGGEAPDRELLDFWGLERGCRVMQVYGPTEAAVVTNLREMKPGDIPNNIGCPLPTVHQYILHPSGGTELVPYGARGELCIAGPQLSHGYLARAEATRAAFVQVKICGTPVNIYRTGDLARWLPNGEVQLLGRKDGQIKINGRRLELGEIEQVFRSSRLVRDCAAIAAELHGLKQLQIVMFIVFKESSSSETRQLKRKLWHEMRASSLMEYMLPRFLMPVEEVRRLESTKVDRKYLLQEFNSLSRTSDLSLYIFDGGEDKYDIHGTAPTQNEKLLAGMWLDIFKLTDEQSLDRNSHFLAHGGDSMTAVALSRRALAFNFHLPSRVILKHPVLRDMARQMMPRVEQPLEDIANFIETPRALQEMMNRTGLTQDKWAYLYPCLPGQAEFLSQGAKEDKTWVLQTTRVIPPAYNLSRLQEEIESLTKMNDILRTTFGKVDGKWYGLVLHEHKVSFEHRFVATRAQRDEEVGRIYLSDFEFGEPFIRYAVIHQPDCRELVIKMDHGIYDGTLLKILARQARDMQRKEVEASSAPFKNLAFYHINDLRGERMAALANLASKKPFRSQYFDIDDPDAAGQVFVDRASVKLRKFAGEVGVTVPVLIQAAFQVVLSKLIGEGELSFDSLFDGRHIHLRGQPDYDIAAANGPCVNFSPMLTSVSGSIGEYLSRSHAAFREAADNAVLSLDEIYSAWGLDRNAKQNQVLFLYQPFTFEELWMFRSLDGADGGRVEENYGRWGAAKGLETKMRKPYALIIEACELPRKYDKRIKVSYDPRLFDADQAICFAESVWDVVERMIKRGSAGKVEEITPEALITTKCRFV